MNISPIQLLDSTFLKIDVEHSDSVEFASNTPHNPTKWDQVSIGAYKNFSNAAEFWKNSKPPVEGMENRTFAIQLGIKSDTIDGVEWSPYSFEIAVGVIVSVTNPIDDETKLKKMAFQYGLQFAFGAIRELMSSLTSRMQWGQMLLPAMSFMDENPDELEDTTGE